GLVVGWDTRFGSDRFAEAVAEVVTAAGIKVVLGSHFAPTPACSVAVIERRAGGGVVITSSHNPAEWNGFKYKPDYAGSASPEVVTKLEAPLEEILAAGDPPRLALAEAERTGLLERANFVPAYLQRIGRLVDLPSLQRSGLRVAVDSMYGAGQRCFAELFASGSVRVTELHNEYNPRFPGIHAPEPIARNLQAITDVMQQRADPFSESSTAVFDLGLATDGDADRLGVLDENGAFVTQLQVFALLAYYFLEVRGMRGPIIRSLTTTRMVDRLGEIYGVPVEETAVGFKYIGPRMMALDALLGGEESGGYGFRGHIPERDGVLAGLFMLDLVARTGKRPTQLIQELYAKVGPHYYDRADVSFDPAQRAAIIARLDKASPAEVAGQKVTGTSRLDGYLWNLAGGGWLLIRFSGTEPLMRIYTEVQDERLVPEVLAEGKRLAGIST
ncbi:MAG TPA: phosphoglucomutase/phosphomannomutase family protein, partial [Dehalococcoidia bacterium]|nr:phosphoglucomutase/phosphomannomutase family protein [Dehalococcoidia bacterium]